jgi:hypothetical protein
MGDSRSLEDLPAASERMIVMAVGSAAQTSVGGERFECDGDA